jgi:Dockerin type I domain
MHRQSSVISIVSATLAFSMTAIAAAETVHVTVNGTVEYSSPVSGPLAPVNPGQPATIAFTVDSDTFVNNPTFPTRGYPIQNASFSNGLGPVTLTLKNPFPGTPYFVIRNNDPAVDGFVLSTGLSLPAPLPLNVQGAFGPFGAGFYVTYTGNTLPSLNILDALGTYEYAGLTVFYWTIQDGPVEPVGMIFESITLSVAADLNGDGTVNAADLAILLGAWGPCAGCDADLNGDGTVDAPDLAILLGAWS